MHPDSFIRKLEGQLNRVRLQYTEVNNSASFFDITSDELLENAKTWFLRTIQNIDSGKEDDSLDILNLVSDESLSVEDNSKSQLRNPSLAWMISHLDRDQIESIFGVTYYDRLMDIAKEFRLHEQTNGASKNANGDGENVQS